MSTKNAKATPAVEVNKKDYLYVSPSLIVVDEKENPRQDYGNIEELMLSIYENGMRQPLMVYEKNGKYVLKNGFRRMRAVNLALEKGKNIERVPVLLESSKLNEEERTLEHILNNDGKPLTMLEQSEVIRRLMKFGWKITDVVKRTGKARGYIENLVLLINAPMKVQNYIKDGKISAHAVIQIMQAMKSDGEKVIQEVEEAIKNAAESGKKMATPKHVKNKDVQSQSFGKFYKWCEEIADTMAGNDYALKPRTELLEKLLIRFENGVSASQVAEEIFTDKTKLRPEPTKNTSDKKSAVKTEKSGQISKKK
jgi:ParB/RepB/Spo0J family partition protein